MKSRNIIIVIIALLFNAGLINGQSVEIVKDRDTIDVCDGTSIELIATGAESYSWSPSEIIDNPSESTVVATPIESGYIFVTGIINGEETKDSVFINFISADITVTLIGSLPEPLCEGLDLNFAVEIDPAGGEVSWQIGEQVGLFVDQQAIITNAPRNGLIIAVYEINGCVFSDTIAIDVIEFGIPEQLISDTIICQGQSVQIATETGSVNTTYTWQPTDGLTNPQVSGTLATPQMTTEYKLIYASQDGACIDSIEATIEVIPIELDLNVEDTVYLCLGDSIIIIATVNGSDAGLSWGPDDGALSSLTGRTVTANPDYSNFYYARYELNGCVLIDTFFIQVDSLPVMPITAIVAEPEYCPGEIVVLLSPEYNGILYPDITHSWEPQDGSLLSDPNFYNLTFETQITNFYIRTTTNGACTIMDSIEIIVKDPQIELNINDTIVCPGRPVQLRILNDVEDITWSPTSGLSCSECPDPIATVSVTTTFTVSGSVDGCPASNSVTVRTFLLPFLTIGIDPDQFEHVIGDRIKLIAESQPELPEDAIYEWTYNGSRLNSSDPEVEVSLDNPVNTVRLQYVTEEGCIVVVERTINAVPPTYEIPNAFTPNNDDINDRFQVYLEGNIEVIEIEVFNRWGQRVYSGTDNTGWDGLFNGSPSPPEVYAYKVTIRLGNGSIIRETGDVTLLR